MSFLQTATGSWSSATVTVKVHVVEFPASSVAVQVTNDCPTLNLTPAKELPVDGVAPPPVTPVTEKVAA